MMTTLRAGDPGVGNVCGCGAYKWRYSEKCRSCANKFFANRTPWLSAEREPTELEVAWAAGFYEGEGSCGCSPKAKSLHVSLPQHNVEPLIKLKQLFGGGIHTPVSGRPSIWQIYGPRAYRFLEAIYPYLSEKRQAQVDRAYRGRWPDGSRPDIQMVG